MDSLAHKKFHIVLAEYPNRCIGADNYDDCAVKPVITDGEMKDWSVEDGCLVLDDSFYSTLEGSNVVVRYGGKDECIKWEFVQAEEGLYRIKLPGANQAWSADPDASKSPVTLTPIGSVDPKYQLVKFVIAE